MPPLQRLSGAAISASRYPDPSAKTKPSPFAVRRKVFVLRLEFERTHRQVSQTGIERLADITSALWRDAGLPDLRQALRGLQESVEA